MVCPNRLTTRLCGRRGGQSIFWGNEEKIRKIGSQWHLRATGRAKAFQSGSASRIIPMRAGRIYPPIQPPKGLQNGLQIFGLQNCTKKAFRNSLLRKALSSAP